MSVSLPALRDLIAYERQEPAILRHVRSGYPRFHTHPYVARLQEHLAVGRAADPRRLLTLSSDTPLSNTPSSNAVLDELCAFAGIERPTVVRHRDITVVVLPEDAATVRAATAFLQHTGSGISSRLAEDYLVDAGLLAERQTEERIEAGASQLVKNALASAYGATGEGDVFLTAFGMNAIYAVYRSLSQIRAAEGRKEWVRFGWLFMDTIQIVAKLAAKGHTNHVIHSALHIERLEEILRERGSAIAGILTETPCNPMLQTPDVRALRALADRYGCALVIDATLGTPHNVDILPYADVAVESLTKYASGAADVMGGAIVLNARSSFHGRLRAALSERVRPMYSADAARLAARISGYAERMRKVNHNTLALAEFFGSRKSIRRVRWAYAPESRRNFEAIERRPGSPGGILTLELAVPLEAVYDALSLAKGPSLGAEFTLVGPYLYHAHYDLVASESGREALRTAGLDPELLRVSVGTEDTEDLVRSFAEVL